MVGRLYGERRAAARRRAEELLERFDLVEAGRRVARRLPGGLPQAARGGGRGPQEGRGFLRPGDRVRRFAFVAAERGNARFHAALGGILSDLEMALSKTEKHDTTGELLRRAEKHYRTASEKEPANDAYRRGLGMVAINQAAVLNQRGRPADAIEAASRSIQDPTTLKLEGMVKKIIYNKLNEGELENASLTMFDLKRVQRAFMRLLNGIYHTRIEYPTKGEVEDLEDRVLGRDDEDDGY